MSFIFPALQIVGYKNRGKTTLVSKLITTLTAKGYKVGTIKHDAHDFEMDVPETDTWKHRQAGAHTTAIVSNNKTAWIKYEPTHLDDLLLQMNHVDLVLIEGFKFENYPKIVIIKSSEDEALVNDCTMVEAIASWTDVTIKDKPVFDINDIEGISAFIEKWYTLNKRE
ncbi:MAG: molybdopterin-guanine dinucleotide biosynthesis protein B [Bacilli bacterium]